MKSDLSFFQKLDVPFRFNQRPSPVPGELRLTWGIALLLLIVFYSRGKKTSLQKLHVLNWAVRSEGNRREFRAVLNREKSTFNFIPRVEPSVNRAIQFAIAEKLVIVDQGRRLTLTPKGLAAAREVNGSDTFVAEKSFLEAIRAAATEKRMEELLNWSVLL
jgi:hypothetical protein